MQSHKLHGLLVNICMYFNQTFMAKSCRRKYPIKCFPKRCLDVRVLNICYNYLTNPLPDGEACFLHSQLPPEDQPSHSCIIIFPAGLLLGSSFSRVSCVPWLWICIA
jgi:hypothetical protein